MSEWREVKLTEITSIIGDGLHGTPKYDESGDYYFVNGNNLYQGKIIIKADTKKVNEDEFNKYKKPLADNTILLGINGTIGNLAYYNGEKCVLGKSACYINVNKSVDKYYLYYNFLSRDFQNFLEGIATGTTIPNVPLKGLREYSFLLPPLPEQKAIAGVLSSLDDKIDLLHRQNKTLEAMAETLFRQWFVEEADEGWEEVPLSTFADNIRDNVKVEDLSDHNYYVGLEHIPRRRVILDSWGETSSLESNKSTFKKYDILFGKLRSYFHKVVCTPIEGVCSTDILVIRPKKEHWLPFCLFWFYSKDVVEHSDLGSGGTRMPRTNWEIVSGYKVPWPNEERVIEFDRIIRPSLNKMFQNIENIHTLEKLRDTLLPKLMSGEVRVTI